MWGKTDPTESCVHAHTYKKNRGFIGECESVRELKLIDI